MFELRVTLRLVRLLPQPKCWVTDMLSHYFDPDSISLSMTRNLGSEDVRPQPESPCNWSPPQSHSLCPQVFYGFSTCSGTHLPQLPGIVLCSVLHGQGRIDSEDLAVWDEQL